MSERLPSGGSMRWARAVFAERIVRRPTHASAPFRVEVAHADLVVDRAVLFAPLDHPAAVGALAHGTTLPMNPEQILVKVAAERPPDRVVVENALRALCRRVALQSQAAEFDDDFVRTEWNHRVHAKNRRAKVVGHAGKDVDQDPAAGGESWPADFPLLAAGVRVVLDFHRADRRMAVRVAGVFAIVVPRLHHAGDAVEVVQKIVIELAVGVVPQFVVRIDDGLVEVEDLHWLPHVWLEHVQRWADVVLERSAPVVEVDPDEAAKADLGLHLP